MRFKIGICAAVLVGAAAMLPSDAEAICWYCFQDKVCQHTANGWTKCEEDPGGGCIMQIRCNDPESPDMDLALEPVSEQMQLADGTFVRGRNLAEGVFAIRACTGTRLHVAYSETESTRRQDLARRIELN